MKCSMRLTKQSILEVVQPVAQTYAFFAFVSGSSCVRGGSCCDANITVDVSI
jgi:hypothetical protein